MNKKMIFAIIICTILTVLIVWMGNTMFDYGILRF